MPFGQFYGVRFTIIAHCSRGEYPIVSGTTPSLGDEDHRNGVRLYTTPEKYPVWSSKVVFIPLNTVVHYRYGMLSGGEFKEWESVSERVLDSLCTRIDVSVMITTDEWDKEPPFLNDSEGKDVPAVESQHQPPCERVLSKSKLTGKSTMHLMKADFSLWAKERQTDAKEEVSCITSQDGVVVVSLFLPVRVSRKKGGGWDVKWDYESFLSLEATNSRMRVTRVGVLRYDRIIEKQEEASLCEALSPFNCAPVFFEKTFHQKFYNDFCKGVLWPAFHHVLGVYSDAYTLALPNITELWQIYTEANRMMRDKVVEVYNPGDLVWIHGFHLLLLPSFLSRPLRGAKVGLFLHTPWPSSEIFRTLPFREDLLSGALNADVVGFHLFEYARHFMTACRRILGLTEKEGRLIRYKNRNVSVICIHAGVEPSVIENSLLPSSANRVDNVEEVARAYEDFIRSRFVFLGLDKVELLKGLQHKLLAFEMMLKEDPSLAERVCFLQFGVNMHEREDDTNQTNIELHSICDDINQKYSMGGHPVVRYVELEGVNLALIDRLAYLLLGDCLIDTALRDGMNRVPMEFVMAHATRRKDNPGVVVLSEFSSCIRVLRGALRINPWKVRDVGDVLRQVLLFSRDEHVALHENNGDFIRNHNTGFWANEVLCSIKAVQKRTLEHRTTAAVGLGMHSATMGMDLGMRQLDNAVVMRAYRASKRRLIVVDYAGTLLSEEKSPFSGGSLVSKPCHVLLFNLSRLCSDPSNVVFVVTGRERAALTDRLGELHGLGLAAEHGLFFKWPKTGVSAEVRPWEAFVALRTQSWRQLTKTIMQLYASRTNGAYVEDKGSTLLWQFRDADPDFGFIQSKELEDHLNSVLLPFNVDVLRGSGRDSSAGGYLEVRPKGVNKGAFVGAMLDRMAQQDPTAPPDFVLVVGDEESDEMMFESVRDYEEHQRARNTMDGELCKQVHCFTVTVGKKPSTALNYLRDIEEVHELLSGLAGVSTNLRRNFHSTSELSNMNVMEEKSHLGGDVSPSKATITPAFLSESVSGGLTPIAICIVYICYRPCAVVGPGLNIHCAHSPHPPPLCRCMKAHVPQVTVIIT